MRSLLGLATAAVLAAGTVGVHAGPASGTADGTAAPPAARPDPSAVVRGALAALADRPGQARASDGQGLRVTGTVVDASGGTHVRLDRTYRGLPVVGGDLVVHQTDDDAWDGVSQTLRKPLDLDVEPVLGRGAALDRALAPSAETRGIRGLRGGDAPARLVVDTLAGPARLAWEVSTAGRRADGTPSRLTTYVDARDGSVLRREEGIHTAEGEGRSLYSGTVTLSVTQSGGSYTLTDPARGGARTTDMQNRTDSVLCQLLGMGCSNGVALTSTDASFGNGSTSSRESAAVDAHYGGAVTFDYFKLVHGRNGIFGDGRGAPSRVHYGNNYANAFWDGEKMTYGDGDGSSFGPLVSLDVTGHEMSHGVTENTANLTYSGESGGLNEATSDIFGTMVEFHAANPNDPADYYIGEEFDLADGVGFRRMDDPAKDGSSYSCYTSGIGDADVHHSSGVGNHFFYLLAEGSGSKTIGGRVHSSPTCDGSSVTGIGRDAAQRIWFAALDGYFTSGTTYAQARAGTLSAAGDLFGEGSAQQAAVAAAWSAVGVG